MASNDVQSIGDLKQKLHTAFKLKDLGNLRYFLDSTFECRDRYVTEEVYF